MCQAGRGAPGRHLGRTALSPGFAVAHNIEIMLLLVQAWAELGLPAGRGRPRRAGQRSPAQVALLPLYMHFQKNFASHRNNSEFN